MDTYSQDESSALTLVASRTQVVRYVAASSLTVLVWNWITNIADEVELIWMSKSTLARSLYLAARYISLLSIILFSFDSFSALDPEKCRIFYKIDIAFAVVVVLVTELIPLWRTHALWNTSTTASYTLGVLYVVWAGVWIYTMLRLVYVIEFSHPPPGITGCYIVKWDALTYVNSLAMTVLEMVIAGLILFKAFYGNFAITLPAVAQDHQHVGFRGALLMRSELFKTLYRDSAIYFLVVCGLSVANLVNASVGPPEYSLMLGPPKRVLHNVLGCHIILNLRAAARGDTAGQERTTYNISLPQTELVFRPEWLLYSDVAAVDIDATDGATGQSETRGSETSNGAGSHVRRRPVAHHADEETILFRSRH